MMYPGTAPEERHALSRYQTTFEQRLSQKFNTLMKDLLEQAKRKNDIVRLESLNNQFDPFLHFLAFETTAQSQTYAQVDCPGHAEYVKNLITGMHEGWIVAAPVDTPSPEEIADHNKAMDDLLQATIAFMQEQRPPERKLPPAYRQMEFGERTYPILRR